MALVVVAAGAVFLGKLDQDLICELLSHCCVKVCGLLLYWKRHLDGKTAISPIRDFYFAGLGAEVLAAAAFDSVKRARQLHSFLFKTLCTST